MQFFIRAKGVSHFGRYTQECVTRKKKRNNSNLFEYFYLVFSVLGFSPWGLLVFALCVRERGAAVFQLQPDDDDNSWLDCWRTGRRYVSLVFKGDGGAHARESRERGRDDDWVGFFLPKCCHFTSFHQGYHNNFSFIKIRLYSTNFTFDCGSIPFFFLPRMKKGKEYITCSSTYKHFFLFPFFYDFMAHFICDAWSLVVTAVTTKKLVVENHTIFPGEFQPEPSPEQRNFLIFMLLLFLSLTYGLIIIFIMSL